MALTVTVGGNAIQYLKNSLYARMVLESRGTANFVVYDEDGSETYTRGMPILIYDSGALAMGGVVFSAKKTTMGTGGIVLHEVKMIDWQYLADKRLIAESYLAETSGDIVRDFVTNYFAAEGITIGNIEDGPTVKEAIFNYAKGSLCMNKMAEKAGFIWFIDKDKKLYFQLRTTTAAPWNADAADHDFIKESFHTTNSNPRYRNRQYIRGGKGTTAVQTENFTGDAVRLSFTVGYPIVKVPTVEVNSVAQTIGIKGIDTAKDCYWNKGSDVIVFETAPPNAEDVEIVYFGEYDILVLVENEPQIAVQLAKEGAGTGWNDAIDDEPTLTDTNASIEAGEAKINRFSMDGKRVVYDTQTSGLAPGQTQDITYAEVGLSLEACLIESVTIHGIGGDTFYKVVGIQGPTQGNWSDYFRTITDMKHELIDSIKVGSEQILIILVSDAEVIGLNELIEKTAWACTVVDGVVCGGTAPIVC